MNRARTIICSTDQDRWDELPDLEPEDVEARARFASTEIDRNA
jgi:hypothetical protein